MIRSELYRKGISREIIEEVINTEDTEVELALKSAEKKIKQIKQSKSPKQLISYLARRGFSWDTIKTVLDKISAQE